MFAFEQGTTQLETLNLDASGSPVNFIERRAIVYNIGNHKSESKDLNQIKKRLTAKGGANFSDLSDKAWWLLEEIIQNLQKRFPENYRYMDIELLESCKHLSEFCTWNELDLNKFKADLLESIENKLRSMCGMSDY